MVPETRLPRTRSATALAAAQHSQHVQHVQPHPQHLSGIPAPPDKTVKGHLRRQSGIARPRISVLSKPRSRGNLAQEKEHAPPTSMAPAPARMQHPAAASPPQVSQIPQRSAIPRPVTMSSIASLLRDSDQPGKADKADKSKFVEENGKAVTSAESTVGSTTGSCTDNTPEARALRSTRSFTSTQRQRTTSTKSGTENASSSGSMASPEASKDSAVDPLEKGKTAKGKDKAAKPDQHALASGRVPLSDRLKKAVPASPGLMSPPKPSTHRALRRRPQSVSDTASLFASVSKNNLPSLMRLPPRMKFVQDAEVEFDLDSPSPLPGSLAASKNGKKSASSTPSSISSTPNSSFSRATGAASAATLTRDTADIAVIASPRPSHEGFIPPPQFRAPSKSTTATPISEPPTQPIQNDSPITSRFGSAPTSPTRAEATSNVKRPSFGRLSIPNTPAIRQLIARERELSRVTDMSGILEMDMDISLASNASFGTLTPPASRLMQSAAQPAPQPSPAANRFGFEREKLKTFEYPHASNTELQAALARLQDERGDLEARVASLAAEESRLKSLADRAMRDREDARAAQEEAEARRDVAMWDALVQSLDEAIEEENALRGTIACLRAVVQAM